MRIKMKKKILAVFATMILCVTAAGCGEKENTKAAETIEGESAIAEEPSIAEETSIAEEVSIAEETSIAEELIAEEPQETEERQETQTAAIRVEIPEGFTESSEGIYVADNYPEDGSNIIVMTTPGTSEIPTEEAMKDQFAANLGEDAEIAIEEYEQYKAGDYDALRVKIKYVIEGAPFSQIQCMVFGEKEIGFVAYTQPGDGAWDEAFEKSAATITME